jgi:CubicO group peptidase (beta-lactamase class C family)
MTRAAVDGFTSRKYASIVGVFRQLAEEDGGVGSSFAVVQDGELVVNLWAGMASRERGVPWTASTIAPMFSGTKGLVALAVARLVEEGRLELDKPVAQYWPEFGTSGKADLLVAHALSHRAGIPGIRQRLDPDDLLDEDRMVAAVAFEAPMLAPGSAVTYHPFTFGWICAGLVRCVTGGSIGNYITRSITGPLGLQTWIGLPEEQESRVATLEFDPPGSLDALGVRATDTLVRATLANPVLPQQWWNSRPFRAASIPGANGITDAASMARLYGTLVSNAGPEIIDRSTLDLATRPLVDGIDALSGDRTVFGVGFQLDNGSDYFGGVRDAFGHGGVGGGRHGAWRARRTGFSYLPGFVRDGASDSRARRLLSALAVIY